MHIAANNLDMSKMSYEKKKKELASKGMPNPKVGKNVTKADKDSEMGCKTCGSRTHKTSEHK